jgi:Heparinase II/III-like protein/Heparinase II/III N-terminus
MATLLARLSQAPPEELRFRLRERTHVLGEALRYASGLERWRRERLHRRLLPLSPHLIRARRALEARDYETAHTALRLHFLERPPRFLLESGHSRSLAADVNQRFPSAREAARRRAEALLADRYDLLGYHGLGFGRTDGDVDWHYDPVHRRRARERFWFQVPFLDPRSGDHKIIWELNRHQHWLALGRAAWLTGDERYVDAFSRQLASWMQANPPLAGINWASMLELAFRCLSWIWSLHFFLPFDRRTTTPWTVDLLVGLDRQLDHVARHLSVYFSPNTHLLGEGLALYVAGRSLPELESAGRWEEIGRSVLMREATAQVNADGGHRELSTHYHRYALDFYLLALLVARRTGDEIAGRLSDVVARLAAFCRALADDDGRLPTLGDDDGGVLFGICGRLPADAGDSLELAALLLDRPDLSATGPSEEVCWMTGGVLRPLPAHAVHSPVPTQVFPDTGYAVLRAADGRAIVDVGPHGFLNGGHAHADALSIVLSVGQRPLLIDPGTCTYTMDAVIRNRFRSTAMHNTAVIDGRSQSDPAGPFGWETRTDAAIVLWRSSPALDYVEARHDGYGPVTHNRAVLRIESGLWLIVDHIIGPGSHGVDTHWHLDAAWSVEGVDGSSVQLEHRDGVHATLASTAPERSEFCGDVGGLGWSAPVYGRLEPSTTLRFSRCGVCPLSIVTAIRAGAAPVGLRLETAPIGLETEDDWQGVAVTFLDGLDTILALSTVPCVTRASGPSRRSTRRVIVGRGALTTDARVAVLRLSSSGEPLALSLIDARAVSWTGDCAFTLVQPAAGDLHLGRESLGPLDHGIEPRRAGTR